VNDFVRPESMEVPDGGLATFLTATVGDWADDNEGYIPPSGIGGVKSVADKLAEYGRYEDTYMVHAAEGETVIPMAVFDENPRLKETLFNQMRSMGIDPEQYVVGSELNSLNPVTGQPEFFLKKLFRGLKKAVKKVVKVIKKVAPIALSIGLSFTPLGAIAGAALGSGIGTLIQGGSLKDAIKMGAIGGLTAGLFKGVTGGIGSKLQGNTFGSGFKAGIQSGLPDAMRASQAAAVNQTAAQAANQALPPPPSAPAGSTTVTGATNAPVANIPGADTAQQLGRAAPTGIRPDMQTTVTAPRPQTVSATPPVKTISSPLPQDSLFYEQNAVFDPNAAATNTAVTGGQTPTEVPAGGISDTIVGEEMVQRFGPKPVEPTPGFFRSVKDMFVDVGPGDKGFFEAGKDAFFPSSYSAEDVLRAELGLPPQATVGQVMTEAGKTEGLKELGYRDLLASLGKAEGYNPNFLRRFGPAAGAGLGILGLTGGFEGEDIPVPEDPFGLEGQSAFDLLTADPQKYRVFYSGGPYKLSDKPYGAAAGGSTDDFPRRDGAIAGPGTGTSDDIPAMLSDGEFVMTANAVRGAGNGDRKQGVRKMYEIMRTYEGVA
jgi:hypothetical protein